MKRECSGDVFRCLLMFGICLLHSIINSDYNKVGLANVLECCVTGFVFISGWYGIKFTWKKFFYLWWISVFCGLALTVGYDCIYLGQSFSVGSFVKSIYMKAKSHWFLNAYAVLMLLAPILNKAIEDIKRTDWLSVVFPMVVLVFGWSWAAVKFRRFLALPCPDGFGSYTFLMMLGVYVVARLLRKSEIEVKLSTIHLVVVGAVTTGLVAMGGGSYASPFSLVLAGTAFLICRRISWPEWLGRTAVSLGPSMFAVYLFHAESQGVTVIRLLQKQLVENVGVWLFFLLCAGAIFAGGLIVDVLLRRSLERGIGALRGRH